MRVHSEMGVRGASLPLGLGSLFCPIPSHPKQSSPNIILHLYTPILAHPHSYLQTSAILAHPSHYTIFLHVLFVIFSP